MRLSSKFCVSLLMLFILSGCSAFPEYAPDEPETVVVEQVEEEPEVKVSEEEVDTEVIEEIPNKGVLEVEEKEIECEADEDCGEREIIKKSCFQGNVNQQFKDYECFQGECKVRGGSEIVDCDPLLEVCAEGDCLLVATQPCTDTDGGINETKEGKVYDGTKVWFEDVCLDGLHLKEAYCSGGDKGKVAYEEISCSCVDNECVTS